MKYTDILLASVAALVFLGCDGDGVPEPDTEGNALQLRSVELSDPSVTRALGATQLTKIGVYVTDNAHADCQRMPNPCTNWRMEHGVQLLLPI